MDCLIHIAGHDWETNWCKRRELCHAFMNAVPDQLHWKLSGHCDTDLLDLAILADNTLLDSKKRRNQRSNHTSNFSSSAFTSTHSQSPPNVSKQPLTALQAQMHEMQTGLSRMAANTSKPWRYSKNQQNSLYFVSRRKSHSIHEFFCTNATLTSLTIPSSASVTTVSKQTPANAKILTATQGTLNQMSSKFRLQTQNKSLAICSKTRTIRTGVTTTTSSEIAHETAKCLVRTAHCQH